MELLMCRACGEFVQAHREEGGFVPGTGECPHCGGTEFKHNSSGAIVRADD